MTIVQAVVLGLVQGITEFLPISSSAHLILVPWLLGWPDQGLGFDIVTNAGTLLAAVLYFRHDLLGSAMSARAELRRGLDRRPGLLLALAVATVPVVVVGLTFYDFFATGARSPLLIAITSIVFGLLLWWVDRIGTRQRNLEDLGWVDSVVIGLAQAVALLPGTSRSGITITAGLWRRFTREDAARFSMLLAIPVGCAALAKDLLDVVQGGLPAGDAVAWGVGFIVSFASAYLAIGWLLAWLREQTMTVFVVYRILLGLVILALLIWL